MIQGGRVGGLADIYTFDMHLHPGVCSGLATLLAGERPTAGAAALEAAGSLVLLTHEGMHFTAVGSNEAVAECSAMQNAYKVAGRLGIDEEYARMLSRLYWDQLYPRNNPVYSSDECRDGGVLDVNPDTSIWP